MTLEDYKRAANRVVGLVAAAEKGRKVDVSRDQQLAMVEMMVADCRDRELRPAEYLQHPAHLPDGKDLQKLVESAAERDKTLRADAIEWRQICRREADRAATSLRNAVTAYRMADAMLNDGGETAEEETLHSYLREIAGYLHDVFACDPKRAPADEAELRAWCLSMALRTNPVPPWLQEWQPGGAIFAPRPRSVADEIARQPSSKESDDE